MAGITDLLNSLPEVWQEIMMRWGGVIIRLILIIVLVRVALKFGYSVLDKILMGKRKLVTLGDRVETFNGLIKSLWRYVVIFVAILMILREFVDITPILAGAGIVGLAVGFGAQSLVKDIITGLFIIIEDQFAVGDYISTGPYSGIVEQVGLRVTRLRDFGGQLHIIPNSKIETVTNFSDGPQRSLIDVSVAYEHNIDSVLEILREECERFSGEYPQVKEGPTVLGVVDLEDSGVVIRIIARVEPMQQWFIERELRRKIKNRLDEAGIEIPYPRRVVIARQENEQKKEQE